MDTLSILDRTAKGQTLYRRNFTKRDGRSLALYGYRPHEGAPIADSEPVDNGSAQLRYHPLRDEWAVYAAHRQQRPVTAPDKAQNPLAPIAEKSKPTEIPFTDFELAVFDNRFSALTPNPEQPSPIEGLKARGAAGACEVIVYQSADTGSFATMGQAQRRLVVEAWIDRYKHLREAGHKVIIPFENRGAEVGATLHHPHGQIYAFDFLPNPQQAAVNAFDRGYRLDKAMADWGSTHHIADYGPIIAVAPPYARFPFECWICPKAPYAGPWDFDDETAENYARALGDIVARYDHHFGRATPFMMTLHASPLGHEKNYHFTTQFYPMLRSADRLKYLASIEQISGVFTVDIMPETTANALRAAAGILS